MKFFVAILILCLSFVSLAGYKGELPVVLQTEVIEQQDKYFIVDVRTEGEFKEGHVPNAVNMPLSDLTQFIEELKRTNKPILVYCRSGKRAWQAEQIMIDSGVTNVYHLDGDMLAWYKNNLPVETKK